MARQRNNRKAPTPPRPVALTCGICGDAEVVDDAPEYGPFAGVLLCFSCSETYEEMFEAWDE